MFIVIFKETDGYFGPFETRAFAEQYVKDCKSKGRVVCLVEPYALGRVEEEEIEASVSLASEHGGT